MLLDLRDGFHQIKVHENATKYFSFATSDGQYEHRRLPFCYCEAPAEFQHRLIEILNPWIRTDKIMVYIDDVFIPSETVKENLEILEEIMKVLKAYKFELNYSKCKVLRKSIEFLGYRVTANKITLNARHILAIKKFVQPRNVLEVRCLGLANYFGKFIKDFVLKAGPLQNLLKKNS